MIKKTKVNFIGGAIELEASQGLKKGESITLSTYGKAIKHSKDSNTPKIGKVLEDAKKGNMVSVELDKTIVPVEGEIWLKF